MRLRAGIRAAFSSRFAKIAGVVIFAAVLCWLLASFLPWSNANSGFISALGLFLIVPFAIWSARIVEHRHRKESALRALIVLEHELWVNLNLVGQIDRSYRNNFELFEKENPQGLHVPHHAPRVAVIEKFIEAEHLEGLSENRQIRIAEIYGQLCELKEEFQRWRQLVVFNGAIINDRKLYEIFSAALIDIAAAVMRNMVGLWVEILGVAGPRSEIPQIRATAATIAKQIAAKRKIHTTYKSSGIKRSAVGADDVIICWEGDWKDAPVEVIELCELAALHPSWVKIN